MNIQCIECGEIFIVNQGEQDFYESKGFDLPKRCKKCRSLRRSEKASQLQNLKKECDEKKIQDLLKENDCKLIRLGDMVFPNSDKTLFIIGNGFDIMHGVKCSYRDFDKTIGRKSELRFYMETFLKCDDLWCNLEYSLSKLDIGAMSDSLDMWLDNFDAYDEDSQIADYYCAIDSAALPIEILTTKLPKRFRKWIESLTVDLRNRPLQNILKRNAIYINFNYTEFLETVYGIDYDNIKYIHGCRVKQYAKPKEELVLGHVPFQEDEHYIDKSGRTNGMVEMARDALYYNWESYYEETFTKKSPEIIAQNSDFFSKSKSVQNIVVLGHSLAVVDYLYFEEIAKINDNQAMWYIGYYSLDDLKRAIALIDKLKIDKCKIVLFRT